MVEDGFDKMRVEENQKSRVSGRYGENDLPEWVFFALDLGQFMWKLPIILAIAVFYPVIALAEFVKNRLPYQKNGGEN